MRRLAALVAPALFTFIVGVGASHLWQVVTPRLARGRPSTGHDIGRGRGKFLRHAGGIPGQYAVVLDDNIRGEGVEAIAAELTCDHGGHVRFVYSSALKGFSVVGMPDEAALALSRDSRVSYVESDVEGKLD